MYTIVRRWTVDEVVQWAREKLNFSDEFAEIIKRNQLMGASLLKISLKEIQEHIGLPFGPANSFWEAIQELKSKSSILQFQSC